MIQHEAFEVEPWRLHETKLDLDTLAQTESVFALSNGHLGLRGNLDEGEPYGLPGTYLAGFYEIRPLPYAEGGYGFPEDGQTVVNVTNGKLIRLLVEDEPLDVRYGELRSHERILDLRAGTLSRAAEWVSPTGRRVRIASTRLVSFTQRAIAAISYEVEPLDDEIPVVVQSELVANEALPISEADPRAAAALAAPLQSEYFGDYENAGLLVHSTKASGLRLAAAMSHLVDGPPGTNVTIVSLEDVARSTFAAKAAPGKPLRLVKLLAYGWSGQRSMPALRDQVAAALASARQAGWEGLLSDQRAFLDRFWDNADVEIDGDTELQQAVRFGLFHTLQAGARGEQRAIAAKGLTGPGYDGHTFWDTESFVLPVLTYTRPRAVGDALRWRHQTLDLARARAKQLGLRGAAFPWRTIHGEECSSYWPAGTAAFHINADIADAVIRYHRVVGDEAFERDVGLELLVETARLWRSLGHHDAAGRFRIDGVTGPDEYSALADNNIYTNLMAKSNLQAAADASQRHPHHAEQLGVDDEEMAGWRDAAESMMIPYDEQLGVHQQAEGFTEHQVWDFEHTKPDQYPLLLHFHYFDLYRKQVVKQADLVLALLLAGEHFSDEEKVRNFAYYERITVRDSSLSAGTQAVIAAETGHLTLAYEYFAEAALMDLGDLEHNTRDGVHIASLAGTWIAAVVGFGGMRDNRGELMFKPRLPRALTRLCFRVMYHGSNLMVDFGHDKATYTLRSGSPCKLIHYGDQLELGAGVPVTASIPAIDEPERVEQPHGRRPAHRRPKRRDDA